MPNNLPRICTREVCNNPADPQYGVCDGCKKLFEDAGYSLHGRSPLNLTTGKWEFKGQANPYTAGGGKGMGQWPAAGDSGGYDGHDDYDDGAPDDV